MIDYIKLNISYLDEKSILECVALSKFGKYDIETGEDLYPKFAELHNLKIKINKKSKRLSGSLHKFYNNLHNLGNQNYNDFSFDQIQFTINYLVNLLHLQPGNTIIQNLEYGVNIDYDILPETMLTENLIVWNGERPTINRKPGKKGKYIQFDKSQYFIKMYDKGQQYELYDFRLRVEKKVRKNQHIEKRCVKTLQDLTNTLSFSSLKKDLINELDKLLILDQIEPKDDFTVKERQIWGNAINPKYWESLEDYHRSKKSRFKKSVKELIQKYELGNRKKKLINDVEIKFDELIYCNGFTDIENSQNATYLHVSIMEECCNFIGPVKLCPITGIDITHQRMDSKHLSENTIIKIYETNDKLFKELEFTFLNGTVQDYPTIKNACHYIAHNIRNKYWNTFYRLWNAEYRYSGSLFPFDAKGFSYS